MKKEENKKQEELNEEQLDNAAGGKPHGYGPVSKGVYGKLK